jgi:hypothetical protein
MHFQLKHAGACLLLAASGAFFSATGCVPDDSSLFIAGCLAVPRDTCAATATSSPSFEGFGTLAGGLGRPYQCAAQVENQLVPTGNSSTLMTETGHVVLQSADIKVLDSTGAVYTRSKVSPGPAEFTIPITGFVPVGQGTTAGLGVAWVELMDSDTAEDLSLFANKAPNSGSVEVQVQVLLHGQTTGGLNIETQKYFLYPITVLAGSECFQPPGDMCFGSMDKPSADCLLGEDEAQGVDCRILAADPGLACANLVCATPKDITTAECPPKAGVVDGSCCM